MTSTDQPVKDIMSTQLMTIYPHKSLEEARDIMEAHGLNHLPVVKDGKLLGILSMTDINRIQYISDFTDGKVSSRSTFQIFSIKEAMTDDVVTVDESTTIREIARVFSKSDFHAIPVTSNGEITGIVSAKDVMGFLVKNF